MKNMILSLTAATLVLFVSSCKKSTSDTPANGDAQISYQLKTENTSTNIAQKTTARAMIVWTSGFAYPSMIKFKAKQNGTEIEYKSSNTQRIDLINNGSVSFGNFIIPSGIYKEVELKLQFDKHDTDPAIELIGQFSTDAMSLPVVLIIDDLKEIKTEQHDVVIDNNTSFTAVTTFDMLVLTSGLTEALLVSAELNNGKIVISSNSNKKLYNYIVDNFNNKKHKCHFDKH